MQWQFDTVCNIFMVYLPCFNVFSFISDMQVDQPDEKSVITYVASLYNVFPLPSPSKPVQDNVSYQEWFEFISSTLSHKKCEFLAVVIHRSKSSCMSIIWVPTYQSSRHVTILLRYVLPNCTVFDILWYPPRGSCCCYSIQVFLFTEHWPECILLGRIISNGLIWMHLVSIFSME